jgi:hypothetical protein
VATRRLTRVAEATNRHLLESSANRNLHVRRCQRRQHSRGRGVYPLLPVDVYPRLGTACVVAMFVPTADVSHRRRALPNVPSSFPASLGRDGIVLGCG